VIGWPLDRINDETDRVASQTEEGSEVERQYETSPGKQDPLFQEEPT